MVDAGHQPPAASVAVRRRVSDGADLPSTPGARDAARRPGSGGRRSRSRGQPPRTAVAGVALGRARAGPRGASLGSHAPRSRRRRGAGDRSPAFDLQVRRVCPAPQRAEGARFGGALASKREDPGMKRSASELEPELESLLQHHPVARHLPEDVRARVLARSRALVSGTSGRRAISRVAPLAAFAPLAGPRPPATSSSQGTTQGTTQGTGLRRMAVAAAIAILAGAAGAFAALRSRAADAPPAAFPASSGSLPLPVREETDLGAELAAVTAAPGTATHHRRGRKPPPALKAPGADPLVEVELLQHAHLAYARRDFRGALALVAEHARRFPDGPLAEECEALRVESLLAAGHSVESRRAGVAFAKRFPRSVLLPGIEETS